MITGDDVQQLTDILAQRQTEPRRRTASRDPLARTGGARRALAGL